jgi:hypothetical protein
MAGPYATKEQYVDFWGYWQYQIDLSTLTSPQIASLNNQILMASGDIDMALKQQGALDCGLDPASTQYLAKLNIINTAVTYRAICGPRLNPDEAREWSQWINDQLTLIREGKMVLCEGDTPADFPAIGVVEIGWNPAISAEIVINDIMRKWHG